MELGSFSISLNVEDLEDFTDVRRIQQELRSRGVPLTREADASTKGPASCMVIDPDGNPVLIDQHR